MKSFKTLTATIAATAIVAFAAGSAHAANEIFLKLRGSSIGDIAGSVTLKGQEGTIWVESVDVEMSSDIAMGTARARGNRMLSPVNVVLRVDKSTPLLLQAFSSGETFSEFRLGLFQPTRGGQSQEFYTIELTNARINGIALSGETGDQAHVEVSFSYSAITETYLNGGITATVSP